MRVEALLGGLPRDSDPATQRNEDNSLEQAGYPNPPRKLMQAVFKYYTVPDITCCSCSWHSTKASFLFVSRYYLTGFCGWLRRMFVDELMGIENVSITVRNRQPYECISVNSHANFFAEQLEREYFRSCVKMRRQDSKSSNVGVYSASVKDVLDLNDFLQVMVGFEVFERDGHVSYWTIFFVNPDVPSPNYPAIHPSWILRSHTPEPIWLLNLLVLWDSTAHINTK